MRRSKFRATQIVGIPKDAEAGEAVRDQLRRSGVSRVPFFRRRSKYSGAVSDAKRLRELEAENTILKRMLADLALEKAAIKGRLDAKVMTPCFPGTIEAFLRARPFSYGFYGICDHATSENHQEEISGVPFLKDDALLGVSQAVSTTSR